MSQDVWRDSIYPRRMSLVLRCCFKSVVFLRHMVLLAKGLR